MKKNDITALHQMSVQELNTKLNELQKSFALASMNNAARKLANTSSLKTMRKDVAVVLTVLKEKELSTLTQ